MSSVTLRTLRLSLIDAFLYYLMVGVGETYLPAYVLSIGMNEVFAGILASLPLVSGAFLQLITPNGIQKVGSHKSWVVGNALAQALAFLPLIYYSTHHPPGFWILFLILTLYWGANFAAGPAWNYWMGHLVPPDLAARYFSQRARISQIGLLIGVVSGGALLHGRVALGPFSSMFGIIFFGAFACRLCSTFLLSAHHYQREWASKYKLPGVLDSVKLFFRDPVKTRFFMYLLPFQIAVYVSAPFVTPWMLAQVKLDYWSYMISIAVGLIAKIFMLTYLQYWQKNIDPFKLFIIGMVAACPSAMLWSLSDNFYYLLLLQAHAGLAWGCYEVALFLIFFQDLKQEEKVSILTIYNVINAIGIIAGTAIGAKFLDIVGTTRTGYAVIFVAGSLLRFTFAFFLIKTIQDWKAVHHPSDTKKVA